MKTNNVFWIIKDKVGIRDGKLVKYDGELVKPATQNYLTAECDISLADTQIAVWGKLEIWKGRGVILKKMIHNDGRIEWVAMNGAPITRPRKEKLATSVRKGEVLFDPKPFEVRS